MDCVVHATFGLAHVVEEVAVRRGFVTLPFGVARDGVGGNLSSARASARIDSDVCLAPWASLHRSSRLASPRWWDGLTLSPLGGSDAKVLPGVPVICAAVIRTRHDRSR